MLLSAQAADASPAATASRVWAVNLSKVSLDLRLGRDGAFQTLGLDPLGASQMVEFTDMKDRSILYRLKGMSDWEALKGIDGLESMYRLEAGNTYLILVNRDGRPGLYRVGAPVTTLPRVAVMNASSGKLGLVEVGTAYSAGAVARAKELAPGWTDFLAVQPGSYGGFWTLPAGTDHFFTPAADGLSLGLHALREGGWYLFMIFDGEAGATGGVIWDISPSRT